jgi:hypothetical protein
MMTPRLRILGDYAAARRTVVRTTLLTLTLHGQVPPCKAHTCKSVQMCALTL